MDSFTAARLMMAMSLGFHILFAIAGMAMPLLMSIAEWKWLRTKDPIYLDLAKRWARGTAIMFAIGAVSGTALSFELGLLWPKFMTFAGPVIGLPLSMEMYAFFFEAIALGIYLYGWNRVKPTVHWISGIVVLISGTLSAVFIVTANAWMNMPTGFKLVDGRPVDIRPWEAMWNPMALTQCVHMVLAAFAALGFIVAAIHARALLKSPKNVFHLRAFSIALLVGGIAALLQPVSGDFSAKAVAKYQPVKLAAMEGHWETEKNAPLRIGGIPDSKTETTPYSIEFPYALSFLATGDPTAEIKGLKEFPKDVRPPVLITHLSFQVMVGLGTLMMLIAIAGGILAWKRKGMSWPAWFLRAVVWSGPAGLIAIEAGWITTEVGRQPWIISGIMRSKDAVTPMPNLIAPFVTFTILYAILGFTTLALLRHHVFDAPEYTEEETR